MGRFHLVYYISMGTPSIEASLQMAETYLARCERLAVRSAVAQSLP